VVSFYFAKRGFDGADHRTMIGDRQTMIPDHQEMIRDHGAITGEITKW
jgi:hypothetical protein